MNVKGLLVGMGLYALTLPAISTAQVFDSKEVVETVREWDEKYVPPMDGGYIEYLRSKGESDADIFREKTCHHQILRQYMLGKIHTRRGDTLFDLAKDLSKSQKIWVDWNKDLYLPNKQVIGNNPNLLPAGITLEYRILNYVEYTSDPPSPPAFIWDSPEYDVDGSKWHGQRN
jgi:hypothetical protein